MCNVNSFWESLLSEQWPLMRHKCGGGGGGGGRGQGCWCRGSGAVGAAGGMIQHNVALLLKQLVIRRCAEHPPTPFPIQSAFKYISVHSAHLHSFLPLYLKMAKRLGSTMPEPITGQGKPTPDANLAPRSPLFTARALI